MTMVAMPTGKMNEMPVAAAGRGASATTGKDAGSPAPGQFAAVLQKQGQTPEQPAKVREADAPERPATGKRAEARGQGRKDESTFGTRRGTAAAVAVTASPVVNSAPVSLAPPNSAAMLPQPAVAGLERSGPMDAAAEVDPPVAVGTAVDTAGFADGEAMDSNGRKMEVAGEERAAEPQAGTASGDESGTGIPAEAKNGSAKGTDVEGAGAAPTLATNAVPEAAPSTPELLAALATTSGTASASIPVAEAASAGAAPTAMVAGQQGSGGKVQGKVSGTERHPAVAGPKALGLGRDGLAKVDGAGGAQTEWNGDAGRGPHIGKGEARPAGNGDAAAETADGGSSAATQPVTATAAPVQAAAATLLPVTAVPVEAPRSVMASDRSVSGGADHAAGLGSAVAGTAGTNADSGVTETAPLTSVGAARLLKTVAGSELRVGTQSADLGAVTIRTVLGREQMQAHISFENERMGSALSSHLLGGALEDRLGQSLGVRASVTLSAGADAGTGGSGRDAAREAMTGQTGGQTGGQPGGGTGGGNGASRDGSGRNGARAALEGFGGQGQAAAGSGVSRSVQNGAAATMEGRLDIRI